MNKALAIIVAIGVAASAFSTGANLMVFNHKYHPKPESELGKAGCMACHTSMKGKTLNPYGTDVKVAMKAANSKKLTADILASIEGKDSTKSGQTNIEKIRAGKNPGK